MTTARRSIPILALLVLTLPGCGTSTPRDPDRPYYGRDRYGPSPAQELAESPFGVGFDPHEEDR